MSSDQRPGAADRLDREFERFVVSASPGLLRSAYLLTGDRVDAEDLLQMALIRTLGRWGQISGPPAAYALAVIVNLSRDQYRATRRRPQTAPETAAPEQPGADDVDRLLERDAITRAARRLPQAQREILACRFVLDLSVAETAVALSVPPGTVKSYTARALTRMRALLEIDRVAVRSAAPEVGDAD